MLAISVKCNASIPENVCSFLISAGDPQAATFFGAKRACATASSHSKATHTAARPNLLAPVELLTLSGARAPLFQPNNNITTKP